MRPLDRHAEPSFRLDLQRLPGENYLGEAVGFGFGGGVGGSSTGHLGHLRGGLATDVLLVGRVATGPLNYLVFFVLTEHAFVGALGCRA